MLGVDSFERESWSLQLFWSFGAAPTLMVEILCLIKMVDLWSSISARWIGLPKMNEARLHRTLQQYSWGQLAGRDTES